MNSLVAKSFLLFCLIVFPAKIYAASSQTTHSKKHDANANLETGIETCPISPNIAPATVRKLYLGIDKIVLYVPRLWTYERALECHEKEAQCVLEESQGISKSAAEKENNITSLKKNFDTFPSILHHKNLLKLFENRIKTGIIPLLNSNKGCTPPELKIVTSDNINLYSNEPKALHIIVKLRIFENTTPKIAMLGFDYYRRDLKYMDLTSQLFLANTIAIPLDETSEKIEKDVTEFVTNPRNISPFTLTQ